MVSWDKQKVANEIAALSQHSFDLNAAYVRDTNQKLFKAAIKYFGSWEAALSACNIEYEHIRSDRRKASYQGLILQEIVRELYEESKTQVKKRPYLKFENKICIPDFVEIEENTWVDVKLHSFSSGIDKTIRKYVQFADKLVILYLLGPAREIGLPNVHFVNIYDYFPILNKNDYNSKISRELDAIKKHYASFPWDLESMSRKWSKEKIRLMIRKLYNTEINLDTKSVRESNNDLLRAAHSYFGGWGEALRSSGIDSDTIMKRRPRWTKIELLEAIKQLNESGSRLDRTSLIEIGKGKLYAAGRSLCGSWGQAVIEAGVDPKIAFERKRISKWAKDEIINQIKRLSETTQNLAASDLRTSRYDLYRAALRYFGNWTEALKAAGLDYIKIVKKEHWSKEKILKEIHSLHKDGIPLTQTSLKSRNRYQLYDSAVRYFGNWTEALEAAKLDNLAIRKIEHWSKEKILKEIDSLYKSGIPLTQISLKARNRRKLVLAAIRHFGGWTEALEAAGVD